MEQRKQQAQQRGFAASSSRRSIGRAAWCGLALAIAACHPGTSPAPDPCASGGAACATGLAPEPELCALEDGLVRVYAARPATPGQGPLRSYGDRVGLVGNGWDRTGGGAVILGAGEVAVESAPGFCDGSADCAEVRTFSRSVRSNASPLRVQHDRFVAGVAASWGERLVPCTTCAQGAVSGYVADPSGGAPFVTSAPAWTLALPGERVGAVAIDEHRARVLVTVFHGPGAPPWDRSATAIRAFPRGATSSAEVAWELDLSPEELTVGSMAVDPDADELYAVVWGHASRPEVEQPAELRVWSLAGAPPLVRRAPLGLTSREVGWSGSSLKAPSADRVLLLGATGGRLFGLGRDGSLLWQADLRGGDSSSHLAGYAADPAAGELVAVFDHFGDEAQYSPSGAYRRSIGFFSYGGSGPPHRIGTIDGVGSLAALPASFDADPGSGEVTLAAGSPAALTTFAAGAPDGADAVRSLPAVVEGVLGPWQLALGPGGDRWVLAGPRDPALFSTSLPVLRLLGFEAGTAAAPQRSLDLPEGDWWSLLADRRRGELWVVGEQFQGAWAPAVVVVSLQGGAPAVRAVRIGQANGPWPVALDPSRDEVWSWDGAALTAGPIEPAQAAPRLALDLGGAQLTASPVVDVRHGELYLPLVRGAPVPAGGSGQAFSVEVRATGDGALLRTLEGVRPSAIALCR